MKKFIVIAVFALMAVVLISGCTQEKTPVNTDNGLVVLDFYADPAQVEENEFVNFILNVQNVGGVDATNVVAELGGVQNQWRYINSPGLVQGPLEVWGGPGVTGPTLEAPNEMYNQPGETRQQVWMLKTPEVGEGITLPATVTAYVTFDYVTTGSMTLKAVSKDYYRVLQGKGEEVTNPFIIVNSNGPLKINAEQIAAPWIVDPVKFQAGMPETSSFLVKFVNVGDGFPYTTSASGRQLGSLTGFLRIYGPASFDDCLGVKAAPGQAVTEIIINPWDMDMDWVKLSKSRGEYPVGCTIKIVPGQWPVTQDEAQIRIDFTLDYRYYVKQDTQVTVRGLSRTEAPR